MCVKVFINTHSGAVKALGYEKLSSILFHELKAAGLDCQFTGGEAKDFAAFAQSAKADQTTSLAVIAGGDGTLAMAAKAFADGPVPIALLPAGTMNLIAHDLGVGGDLEQAISTLAQWRPQRIDVGKIEDRAFLNNIVFGDYADVAASRETIRNADSIEDRLGAIAEAAHTLLNSTPANYTVEVDGKKFDLKANMLMIANNTYTSSIDMRPRRARLDNGKLAIYLADSQDGVELISRVIEISRGELKDNEALDCIEASECTVNADAEHGLVAIDGEPVEMTFPVLVKIMPRALTVLRPDPVAGA